MLAQSKGSETGGGGGGASGGELAVMPMSLQSVDKAGGGEEHRRAGGVEPNCQNSVRAAHAPSMQKTHVREPRPSKT